MGVQLTSPPTNDEQITFSPKKGFDTLKTEDFVKILITQLQNQNPLEPLKDNQLLEQVASIESLSSTSRLVDTLSALGLSQNLGAASNLIGRQVTAKVGKQEISGVVERAVVEDGKVFLFIGENKVSLDSVVAIEDSAASLMNGIVDPTQTEGALDGS